MGLGMGMGMEIGMGIGITGGMEAPRIMAFT